MLDPTASEVLLKEKDRAEELERECIAGERITTFCVLALAVAVMLGSYVLASYSGSIVKYFNPQTGFMEKVER